MFMWDLKLLIVYTNSLYDIKHVIVIDQGVKYYEYNSSLHFH